jgi:hypothetical protein
MVFGIPVTPFNVINAVVLILTIWMIFSRYSRAFGSNLPLLYWAAVIAHTKFFGGGYDARWVLGGTTCCLLLRFEFMNDLVVRLVQVGEYLALGYVLWRTIGLILMW